METLRVGDRLFHAWHEAEERQVALDGFELGRLLGRPEYRAFSFPGRRWLQPLPVATPTGEVVGVLAREQQTVEGAVEVSAARAAEGLFRVTVRVVNRARLEGDELTDRDGVLLRTLVSTHTVLGLRRGAFVSLLDPPEPWREAAAACRNVGTWPVLVGEGGRQTRCSPRRSSSTIIPRWRRRARATCSTGRRSTRS
jgi:hydrogenase maturation protease